MIKKNNPMTDEEKWRLSVSTKLGWITGVVTLQSTLILGLIWSMIRLLSMVASLK